MKLIIQIPCYNEEESLPAVLSLLPRQLKGVDRVEWLLLNDGSDDNSVKIAREAGVDHILDLSERVGLARLFTLGLQKSLELEADIIVNFDADGQYRAEDIEKIIQPIIEKKADFVIGERPIADIENFSCLKKKIQSFGSKVVSFLSGVKIKDATSGFRAISREAALKLNVFNTYTYTLETIIQAKMKGIRTIGIPVGVNLVERPSRLMKSSFEYVWKNFFIILRIFILYRPLLFFLTLGGIFFSAGFFLGLRFLYFYFAQLNPSGHVQSLILSSILITLGGGFVFLGILADLISFNRNILEEIQYRQRKKDYFSSLSHKSIIDRSNNSGLTD